MGFQNNSYSMLGQIVQSTLRQAEQAMQSGRLNPMQSQQKNVQLFRIAPNNTAPAAGIGSQQAVTGVSPARPDPQPENAGTAQPTDTGTNAGPAAAAPVPVRRKPDDHEKLLKFNFNEENLLSGIVMAEVLGKPKCLRRGRW